MAVLIDSYATTNQNTEEVLTLSGWYAAAGMAITLTKPTVITSIKWYLKKVNSPVGNITSNIYASTGTVGSTAVPTGSALYTSSAVVSGSLTASYVLTEFTFTPVLLTAGDYCFACVYNAGNASNYIQMGDDSTSPTHAGNKFRTTDMSAWTQHAANDLIFELYGGYPVATQALIL